MMQLGTCYYPEHWDESTWERDAQRMKDLGLTWIRIGEFAWSRLEPTPTHLNFDWLDKSIDILGNAGLKVMLGTPTATPPKWLCDRYDDIYQYDGQGRVRGFGSRRHYSYNSPSYLQETERIVGLLAERYGRHEAIGAWQTDNEFGCHGTVRSYAPWDLLAFRRWLAQRYEDIEALNEAWWNRFWSMEYNGFDDVELPNLTVTEANPSHVLDFYRFSSDAVIAYNKLQCDTIRQHSDKPISHNVMLYFGDFDHYKLAEDLDIVTWDNYPLGMLEQSPLPDEVKNRFFRAGHPDLIGLVHDLYFGLKRQPFWVIEQQPGPVNWAPSNPLPAKGMVRLWTHQAMAHGADVVSYFRWRSACGAQETMHAGMNRHDGSADRASVEARRTAQELVALSGNDKALADVAILFDYENLWACDIQPHSQGFSYWALVFEYYSALRSLGLDVSFAHPRSDLSPFRVVFAPALHLVDADLVGHLQAYCEAGGQLVVGPRSGVKTLSNVVHAPALREWLELTGTKTSHVDGIRPGVLEALSFQGKSYSYHTWADLFELTDASSLASYRCLAYDGVSAISEKQHGQGTCISLGAWGDRDLHVALFAWVLERAAIPHQALPEGLRQTQRGDLRYTMNFTPETVNDIPPFDLDISS